jgi:hypothetical protein
MNGNFGTGLWSRKMMRHFTAPPPSKVHQVSLVSAITCRRSFRLSDLCSFSASSATSEAARYLSASASSRSAWNWKKFFLDLQIKFPTTIDHTFSCIAASSCSAFLNFWLHFPMAALASASSTSSSVKGVEARSSSRRLLRTRSFEKSDSSRESVSWKTNRQT